MKSYEINYFLSLELNQEEVSKIADRIQALIKEQGGLLFGEKKTAKVPLGYFLRGKKEALMTTFLFELDPGKINELKKKLKKASPILRFMILTHQPAKVKPLKARRKPLFSKAKSALTAESALDKLVEVETKEKAEFDTPAPKSQATKEKKVELQEIEKKLDQLLE